MKNTIFRDKVNQIEFDTFLIDDSVYFDINQVAKVLNYAKTNRLKSYGFTKSMPLDKAKYHLIDDETLFGILANLTKYQAKDNHNQHQRLANQLLHEVLDTILPNICTGAYQNYVKEHHTEHDDNHNRYHTLQFNHHPIRLLLLNRKQYVDTYDVFHALGYQYPMDIVRHHIPASQSYSFNFIQGCDAGIPHLFLGKKLNEYEMVISRTPVVVKALNQISKTKHNHKLINKMSKWLHNKDFIWY